MCCATLLTILPVFFAYLFCSASSPLLSHSVQIKEEQKGEKEFGNEINRAI